MMAAAVAQVCGADDDLRTAVLARLLCYELDGELMLQMHAQGLLTPDVLRSATGLDVSQRAGGSSEAMCVGR